MFGSIWEIVVKMNGLCLILDFFFLLPLISHAVVVLRLRETKKLEVRYKGKWGSICENKGGFDNKEAKVACRQMGFGKGSLGASSTKVTDPVSGAKLVTVVLDGANCTGAEDDFSKCTLKEPTGDCQYAVQVDCESDPALDGLFNVSLIGSPNHAHKGILHATKAGATDAICYDSGTATTIAGIVCKQMGYSGVENQTAASTSSYSSFFTATCKGTEQTLAACTLTHGTSCSSNNVIDIECKLDYASQSPFAARLSQSSIALAGASSGTVEVKKNGKWGVICDTGWDINDANVVCRQLGFKGAVPTKGFPTKAKFGQGTGLVFWNNLQCSGDEQSIAECKHDEVFGACNSSNASGVICSTEKLPTFDICSDKTITIPPGVSFLRSPGYPNRFHYETGTTCSCTFTNLNAATTLTLYIHQKMFQQNHVESLTFYNGSSEIRLYGDDSSAGPFHFTDTEIFTIQFKSDRSAGEGMLNIQIKASEPVSFKCIKGQTTCTTPSVTAPISGLTTTMFSALKYLGNSDPGNNSGVAAAVTGVVIVLLVVIPGIILWRLGYIRFGRKARNSDGNGRHDVSRVTNVTTRVERPPENYVNVGEAYENEEEPVYVNSAFVADQPTNTSQDSSNHHTSYENMGDVAFNQEQHSGNTTALAEPEQGSRVDRIHGNGANNSGADEGESQYAKLEPVQRAEYADFRGLTAEQLKPI